MKDNIQWDQIDHIQFEELAMAYARDKHPEYDWVATSLTRDDNRDGYATFKRTTMEMASEHEVWMEAKYSKKCGSVGRNRMDSTIVSGLLYGNVKVIMFITNGFIPKEYILRAEKVFIHSNDQHLLFIDNPNLTYWLCDNPKIYNSFFQSETTSLNKPQPMHISGLNVIPRSDYNRALYSRVHHCKTNCEYVVNILIDSNVKERAEISVQTGDSVAVSPPEIHDITPGKNSFWKRLTVTEPGMQTITARIVRGLANEDRVEKVIEIEAVSNTQPQIAHSLQLKITTALISQVKKDIVGLRGSIYCVSAAGGMGKSYIFEQLQSETFAGASLHRFELSGSEAVDAQQICRAILIYNFGVIYNAEEIYEALHLSEIKTVPMELVRLLLDGLNTAKSAMKALSILSSEADHGHFLSPLSRSNHKVLLIDDIHKATPLVANALLKLAGAITKYRPNSSAVFAFRQEHTAPSGLISELISNSSLYENLDRPSIGDVCESFAVNNLAINEKTVASFLAGKPLTTLSLYNILDEIGRRLDGLSGGDRFSSDYLEVFKDVLYGHHTIVEDCFRTAKEHFRILDLVYAYSSGIEIGHLIDACESATAEIVNDLGRMNLIKIEDGIVHPYHDTYMGTYVGLRKGIYKVHVGRSVSLLEKRHGYSSVDCLGIIIRCGKRYGKSRLNEAIAERDRIRSITAYGSLLPLAEAICDTLENQPELLSEYETLKSYFIYAESLNHCGQPQKARSVFDIVCKLTRHHKQIMDIAVDGIRMEAQAEILSLDYWDLKTSPAQLKRLTDFVAATKRIVSITEGSSRHIRAYLTALNRLMTTQLLVDEYEAAADTFAACIAESDRLGKPNYRAYAYSDYAKGLYVHDPKTALDLLEKAHDQYLVLGDQERRFLVGEVERSYLAIISGDGNINKLYSASNSLLENGLHSEYRNAVMKIAAILLSKGAHDVAMEKMSGYVAIMKSTFGIRANMLISNLLAAYYHLTGNESERNAWTKKHHSIARNIGRTYAKVAETNYFASTDSEVSFVLGGEKKNVLLIDPRLW